MPLRLRSRTTLETSDPLSGVRHVFAGVTAKQDSMVEAVNARNATSNTKQHFANVLATMRNKRNINKPTTND